MMCCKFMQEKTFYSERAVSADLIYLVVKDLLKKSGLQTGNLSHESVSGKQFAVMASNNTLPSSYAKSDVCAHQGGLEEMALQSWFE